MHRLVVAVLGLLTAACNTAGPAALAGARFDYNEEIARSWNQQLLLNLVRLRYRDTPQFLEVGSVLAQFSLRSGAGLTPVFGVGGGSNNETTLGLNIAYEERPTITLVPLQGEDFTRRLLTPLSMETLMFLSQSGWSVSRLMMMGVQRLGQLRNMPSAAGPTPEVVDVDPHFAEFVNLLRELQLSDALDLVAVARPDRVLGTRLRLGVANDPGEQERLNRLRELLGLGAGVQEIDLVGQPNEDNQVAVQGRSLLGVMFFLSHAVEVPQQDMDGGRVTVSHSHAGGPVDWAVATGELLRIRASGSRPANAFAAIRYRSHWFYIDDRDLDSKSTFFLLSNLFSLQAAPAASIAPALTVSTGT